MSPDFIHCDSVCEEKEGILGIYNCKGLFWRNCQGNPSNRTVLTFSDQHWFPPLPMSWQRSLVWQDLTEILLWPFLAIFPRCFWPFCHECQSLLIGWQAWLWRLHGRVLPQDSRQSYYEADYIVRITMWQRERILGWQKSSNVTIFGKCYEYLTGKPLQYGFRLWVCHYCSRFDIVYIMIMCLSCGSTDNMVSHQSRRKVVLPWRMI